MKQELSFHQHHIPGGAIPECAARLTEWLKSIASHKTGAYTSPEHSIRLPLDPSVLLEVRRELERCWTSQLRYVFVVGIGGSNLGAKAVYDALTVSMLTSASM